MMMLSTSTVIISFLPKKNHLLHIFVVISLEHFIAEYFSTKAAHQDQTYHQQCLSFLVADKCVGETISLPEYMHVNVLNRGGLWKLNEDVIAIFSFAEAYFLSSAKKLQNKILPKDIVNVLIRGGSRAAAKPRWSAL